jgi:hypothetical protein
VVDASSIYRALNKQRCLASFKLEQLLRILVKFFFRDMD